jgi:hypothetical protein
MRVHIKLVMIMELTTKNLLVRSATFPHYNIHKYTWNSPGGKAHNQTDHVFIDRRHHSSTLDAHSFRGADCETDRNLVVTKLEERLTVSI